MQWILQDFQDTRQLAQVLDRLDIPYSFHKVVPFVGTLQPAPRIADPNRVVLFGSYTLWRYAADHGLSPGVFRIAPFVRQTPWQPYLLNGPGAIFAQTRDLLDVLADAPPDRAWFLRPVDDSKGIAGAVYATTEIQDIARNVIALVPAEIPNGSLAHDTELMLCPPAKILKEWRIWVVAGRIVTYSLYKEGRRVVYRPEIDDDARAFAQDLIARNPGYAVAYVLDICRSADGLHLLETNCINAAGLYAADLGALVAALEALDPGTTT